MNKYTGWELIHYPIVNKFRAKFNNGLLGYEKANGQRELLKGDHLEIWAEYFPTREAALEAIDIYLERKGMGVNIEKL